MTKNNDADNNVLSNLRSENRARSNRAYEKLYSELLAHARKKLGPNSLKVNCQAESVVQSVIAKELGGGIDKFESDNHLQGRLRLAVNHKIFDRPKGEKGKTDQISQLPDGFLVNPAESGPGIGTQVAEVDRDHDVELRLTAGLESQDQGLVRMCVLNDLGSAEAGQQLSITASAVRKRLERLRPELRAKLLAPLKTQVSAKDWAFLSACLIERMLPAKASSMLGCTGKELADAHERLYRDDLGPVLGDTGLLALARLLGKPRA